MLASKPIDRKSVNRNCSVFVGNIPYEASEDELKDIFSRAGPVISFRLMRDKQTQQPKGYGFCEYRDMETAFSAMRNLANAEYGGRPLRVDWADHELRSSEAVTKVMRTSNAVVSARTEKIVRDRLQEFRGKITDETLKLASDDMQPFREIRTIIEMLSKEQLATFLAELQMPATSDPQELQRVVRANPALNVAIAYAMLRNTVYMSSFISSSIEKFHDRSINKRLRDIRTSERNDSHFINPSTLISATTSLESAPWRQKK